VLVSGLVAVLGLAAAGRGTRRRRPRRWNRTL